MRIGKEQFSRLKALVVGDVMLDRYWFGSVDRISPEAPVPVLAVKSEEVRVGGAANVAHNLLALGAQSTLLSVVGDDEAGREIKRIIDAYGANTVLKIDIEDYQSSVEDCDVVVLSDYGKGGLRHVARMIAIAKELDKPVIIDPKGSDYSRYRGATLITPNMKEFETVVGHSETQAEFEEKAHALRAELELEFVGKLGTAVASIDEVISKLEES